MIIKVRPYTFVNSQMTVRLARICSFSGSLGMQVLTNGAGMSRSMLKS